MDRANPGPLRWQTWLVRGWFACTLAAWIAGPPILAGTPGWTAFWAYVVVLVAGLMLHRVHVLRRNPGLWASRREVGAGSKAWDYAWNLGFWPLMALVPNAAGLDFRLQAWLLHPAWFVPGVVLLAGGLSLSAWAMGCNPFFEGTVRIQADRGHRVVEAGPYHVIRHPGYLGLCLWAMATPFLLLSGWAFLPALAVVAWVVLRTALEDRTLRRELPGYDDYARRTRYRLVPGAW
mgnify:CR=1 FL=1